MSGAEASGGGESPWIPTDFTDLHLVSSSVPGDGPKHDAETFDQWGLKGSGCTPRRQCLVLDQRTYLRLTAPRSVDGSEQRHNHFQPCRS
jgi:hypothetical protein